MLRLIIITVASYIFQLHNSKTEGDRKNKFQIFWGYRQMDRVFESPYENMSAHKKFQLKAQN